MSHTAILQPTKRVPTGARRSAIAGSLRHIARKMDTDHPSMETPGHLRDAARELERGNTEGAQRHLRAGMQDLAPANLYRHGITTDTEHTTARQHLTSIHRKLLDVKDVEDTETRHRPPLPQNGPSFSPTAIEGEAATPGYKQASPMNAPAKTPTGPSDRAAEGPRAPSTPSSKQKTYSSQLLSLDLSAETARLAVTPAPRGRPGGPGLYDVKGLEHTPYLQQIVKALIEKRGMDPGRAYAIARASIRKWGRGGGNVHPEVRAAAVAAEAGEVVKQGIAKAAHGHSWEDVETAIELAVIDLGGPGSGNPNQQRGPGGKFTAGGGGSKPRSKKTGAGKSMNTSQKVHAKGALMAKAHQDMQKAHSIAAEIKALLAGLKGSSSAAGTSSSAAAGSSKSSSAAGSSSSAASKGASSSSSSSGKSSSSTSSSSKSASQVNAKVAQLRAQEKSLIASAKSARSQARAL